MFWNHKQTCLLLASVTCDCISVGSQHFWGFTLFLQYWSMSSCNNSLDILIVDSYTHLLHFFFNWWHSPCKLYERLSMCMLTYWRKQVWWYICHEYIFRNPKPFKICYISLLCFFFHRGKNTSVLWSINPYFYPLHTDSNVNLSSLSRNNLS